MPLGPPRSARRCVLPPPPHPPPPLLLLGVPAWHAVGLCWCARRQASMAAAPKCRPRSAAICHPLLPLPHTPPLLRCCLQKKDGTPTPDDEQKMMQQMRAEGLMAAPAGGTAGAVGAGTALPAGSGGPPPKDGVPGTRRIRREVFFKASHGSWQVRHAGLRSVAALVHAWRRPCPAAYAARLMSALPCIAVPLHSSSRSTLAACGAMPVPWLGSLLPACIHRLRRCSLRLPGCCAAEVPRDPVRGPRPPRTAALAVSGKWESVPAVPAVPAVRMHKWSSACPCWGPASLGWRSKCRGQLRAPRQAAGADHVPANLHL